MSWKHRDDEQADTRNPWGNPWDASAWAGAGYGFWGGRNFRILSGLRRDPRRGKISGVCAGIAGYYGISLTLIRIGALFALLINPFLAIAAYVAATFLLQPLPDAPRAGGASETNAGTSAREREAEEELPPELRFAALKDKFRELQGRTGEIETLVTSPEFHLRRDFKKMGEA